MSADIIEFPVGRAMLGSKPHKQVTCWVPDYTHRVVDGIGVPYWTGREVLCRLIKNPAYTGDLKAHPYEIPYIYETIGTLWDPVQREAPPPDCPVSEFNWDEFEKKAVWS